MKKISINCPVCNSLNYKLKYTPWVYVDDPNILYGAASGIPGAQTLVSCIDCDLLYENPRFPDEIILRGYTESNDEGHDSQHQMRVKSFQKALEKNEKFLPAKGSKVLDIGTAGGAFLDAAKNFGYEAWGMEPSLYLTERGKERGLKILQGTIDSNDFEKSSFDLICLWDVIEHLTKPRESLEKIYELLKPNGILLINYPDISTWQAKIFGKRFWWIISVHLTHFSPKTIKKICEFTGFEIQSFQSYWQILEFGYLAKMAIHFKVPFAKLGEAILPQFIKRIPLPYYASQTTAIAKKRR